MYKLNNKLTRPLKTWTIYIRCFKRGKFLYLPWFIISFQLLIFFKNFFFCSFSLIFPKKIKGSHVMWNKSTLPPYIEEESMAHRENKILLSLSLSLSLYKPTYAHKHICMCIFVYLLLFN